MITTSEAIGMAACVVVAMALASYLIYLKADSQGHPTSVICRGLVTIWLCLGVAIAVLIAARSMLGGPLFDINLGQGQGWWQPSVGSEKYVLIGAVVTVVGLAFVAVRTARKLQEPTTPGHNNQDGTARGGLPS